MVYQRTEWLGLTMSVDTRLRRKCSMYRKFLLYLSRNGWGDTGVGRQCFDTDKRKRQVSSE
jgi:hypothetical protein